MLRPPGATAGLVVSQLGAARHIRTGSRGCNDSDPLGAAATQAAKEAATSHVAASFLFGLPSISRLNLAGDTFPDSKGSKVLTVAQVQLFDDIAQMHLHRVLGNH